MIRNFLNKFWAWYERNKTFNVGVASFLFILQLVHLYWLTTHVVFYRLLGRSFFNPIGFWQLLIIVVDYTEIPALFTTSFVYINELRKSVKLISVLFLIFLNIQFLHIFWITDEFVVNHFINKAHQTLLPTSLAWFAILIDYLELPVIFDTLKKFFYLTKENKLRKKFKRNRYNSSQRVG